MSDINKIALDYLNTPIVSIAKSKNKSRKGLTNSYERIREKYMEEKKLVDQLRAEGVALQKKFDARKAKMDALRDEMAEIRKQINKMDDLGEDEKEEAGEESSQVEALPAEEKEEDAFSEE